MVGAVIVEAGLVYCTRRGQGSLAGMWEFPGGKLDPGETPETALAREIAEELSCTIQVGDQIVTTTHEYDFAYVTLTTFYCSLAAGRPTLSEHIEDRWLRPAELSALSWAPADIPAVHRVQSDLGS